MDRVKTSVSPPAIIRITNLHKWFGRLHVLRGINLEVAAGEKICVVGPSGSGKSTLLRCVNFLEEPSDGIVFLDGRPMGFVEEPGGRRRRDSEANINRMRARVGMVFQICNLWTHMTALRSLLRRRFLSDRRASAPPSSWPSFHRGRRDDGPATSRTGGRAPPGGAHYRGRDRYRPRHSKAVGARGAGGGLMRYAVEVA